MLVAELVLRLEELPVSVSDLARLVWLRRAEEVLEQARREIRGMGKPELGFVDEGLQRLILEVRSRRGSIIHGLAQGVSQIVVQRLVETLGEEETLRDNPPVNGQDGEEEVGAA